MQYRRLGKTDLQVSFVGLGTGGPSRLGQNTHGDATESVNLVRDAFENGINLFDTAAAYADSELLLGRALNNIPRDQVVLATKFTPTVKDTGEVISPGELIAACEKSLRRMGTEVIDIYQFHGLVPGNYRAAVDRLYPTMEQLQQAGKIRFVGVTEYFFEDPSHQMLKMALAEDIWATVMVKYGILNMTAADDVLPLAGSKDVGVFNMSPVRVKMTKPDALEEMMDRWKQRGWVKADDIPEKGPLDFTLGPGVDSVVQAGYKFGADHDAISSVIVGTGNADHLMENIETILGEPLPSVVMDKLRRCFGEIVDSEGDTG